jgi:glycosyltransferase involved in cell wall biosynthesis
VSSNSIDPAKIAIVIPVHNRRETTRSCLTTLQQQTLKGFRVIIADDGSTDGTEEMIRSEFPYVELVSGDGNLWWSGSMNLGVRKAKDLGCEYVISLNDDAAPEPDMVEAMANAATSTPRAIQGAFIIDQQSGRPHFAGRIIRWTRPADYLLDLVPEHERKGLHELDHYFGWAMWIPMEVFNTVGYFDEAHFPQYEGDTDLTLRATEHGFPLYVNFEAKLRVDTSESGLLKVYQDLSWSGYWEHLTGQKGSGNLARIIRFGVRHAPRHLLLRHLLWAGSRALIGYPVRMAMKTLGIGQPHKPMAGNRSAGARASRSGEK